MLTSDDNPQRFIDAFHAGADGFMVKGEMMEENFKDKIGRLLFPEDEIIDENDLLNNAYLITRGVKEDRIDLLNDYYKNGFPDLEVLAKMTGISRATVARRLTRIEGQLGVKNRAQLARLLTVLAIQRSRCKTRKCGQL
jgi:DNA-binding NarL/FixJ family response regulator